MGISRFSKKPDLAWRFAAFMTGEEMQSTHHRPRADAPRPLQ
jgi:ABC-type glycerol-3-phosphate transport system substrate-binding protein